MISRNVSYKKSLEKFNGRPFMCVEEFLRWVGISRFLFYKLVKNGDICPRKIAGRTVIPVEEAERWLKGLPEVGVKKNAFSRPKG